MSDAYETTRSGWDARSYRSFCRFLEAIGNHSAGASLIERDGVAATVVPAAPERSPFNAVAYEHPLALEEAYDDLAAAYAEAGIRAWTVWVPEADSDRIPFLSARGHELDARLRSMAFDLDAIPAPDDELEFSRSAGWRDVCEINDAAHGLPGGSFEAGMGSAPDPALRVYGADHSGWMASTLATLDHQGDCGVYLVATLPEARGNRYAGRLLHRALLDARKRGCESSTLQAGENGAPGYARLGYRDRGGLDLWECRSGFPD